jgi:hypothetical protein
MNVLILAEELVDQAEQMAAILAIETPASA